jgi:hypothetical protein
MQMISAIVRTRKTVHVLRIAHRGVEVCDCVKRSAAANEAVHG